MPCQNEDGTTNMECMDGNTAGTPPSWGAPLWTIQSIFLRDGDTKWVGKMYPLLKGYLNFWLHNRTDAGGYVSRAVQFHPDGGRFDFVWLPARTMHPHVGPQYVWCLTA